MLEGLVQKIESVDVQLHTLQRPVPTAATQPLQRPVLTAATQPLNVASPATADDSTAANSVEEANKMYLSSLDAEQVCLFFCIALGLLQMYS